MATLKDSTVTVVQAARPATNPTELVRKTEMDAALAGKAAAVHTHAPDDIGGLALAVTGFVRAATSDSQTITWQGSLSPSVRLRTDSGFLSAADKRKRNAYEELQRLEVPVSFHQDAPLAPTAYLSGRVRFRQLMQVERVEITAMAPSEDTVLKLIVQDVADTGITVAIPAGVAGNEVTTSYDLYYQDFYIGADRAARWQCISGPSGGVGTRPPTLLSLMMTARPPMNDLPQFKLSTTPLPIYG